jgi:type VI secretion system secreted protein Hcp
MALVDMFLKLDGVNGESEDPEHKAEIQLDGFRLNLVSPRDSFTNQASGARRWSHLSIRAKIDMSTPLLFLKLATNTKIATAVLTCRKAGKVQFQYFKITLSEVLVVKVEAGEFEASGASVIPHCDFDLSFGKIEILGSPQTSTGPTSGTVSMQDDLRLNSLGRS